MTQPAAPDQHDLSGRRAAVVNWRDLDHSQAGGAESYAWEFARALAERGAAVDFVTSRDRGQSRSSRRDGIRILRHGGTFTFYLWAAFYLLTRRRQLDLVVDPECGIPVFSPLFLSRRTAVILIVHHIHQQQFAQYFPAPLARVGQFLEAVVMPRVYRGVRTLAVSESTREEMRSELGWTGAIELLHNGTNPPPVTADLADHDPRRLVALGRLVPHKNVDLALEVVAELGREFPGLRLDVVGRGPEEARLRALVADLGLEEVVTIHGFVSEARKAELLRAAGLQLCGSDNEGWGQVVIETAAYGVPTVARDVAGLRDSILDGRTGWLGAPEPQPTSRAIARERLLAATRAALGVLSDPENALRIQQACHAHAAGFDWTRMRADAGAIAYQEIARHKPEKFHY